MATDIDSLQIQINAQATKANDAIDRLAGKIDRLTTSLSKIDGSKLVGLSNGVQRLGTAMQTMNTIKTADFTRLATNLTKLGSVNVSALNSAASSMSHLTRAFNNLGTVSANATAVGELAKNISKLGNKSVQTAITNIPQLATSLNGLMTTLSKAPRVSQNVIQMTNALANLTAQGSKVGSASNSIVKGLNRASTSATRANKSFKGLASAFGTFYANCFLIIRGVKALWNSINSTADYLEAFNYFEVALNKVGGDWAGDWEKYSKKLGVTSAEEYANSFKTRLNESLKGLSGVQISIDANGKTGLLTDTGLKNLGLNIQEVTQYASQLASVTNSVGQTGETTLAAASAFTKLGADMSSLFNVDYSSVMNNLQSGLIGQSRALYKYGIDITNATLQTYAYGLGVEKAVSEMTQAEKMQLRMIAILDQSKVAWGDQANTINSLSNSIRQFKNNISEAGQILGQLFVPILSKVMPIVNGLVIAIKRLMVSIAGLFGIKLDLSEFGQGTSGATDDMDGFSDSLDNATSSAEKLKKATTTLGIDELNINSPQTDTSSGTYGGVSGGGIDLTESILKATEEYEKAWKEAYDRMQNKAEEFADRITALFDDIANVYKNSGLQGIGEFFSSGLTNALESIPWKTVYEKARSFGTGLAEFLNGLISPKTFSTLGKTIANSLNTALSFLNLFGKRFGWGNFGTSLADGIKGFFETWDAGLTAETLSTFANGILVAAKSAIDELGENNTFEDIGQKLVDLICGIEWGDLSWNLTTFFVSMEKALGEFPTDFAKGVAEGILEKIFNQEVEIELPEWLENGIKYMFVGATPHIALLAFLPSQEEFNDWFINDVSPWFSKEKWNELGNGILEGLQEKWEEIKQWWSETAIFEWWENDVKPWFSSETWLELLSSIKESFQAKWNETVEQWKTDIKKWWNENVEPWFTKKKWTDMLQSIPTVFKEMFRAAANGAIGFINNVIGGIESMVNNAIEALAKMASILKNIPGVNIEFETPKISLPRIPTFSIGGFPEDGLFMANHNELVGQFSNGRTAVANNEQITEGIKQGVKEAVSEILAPYLAEIAQNTRETADKDFDVSLDSRSLLDGLNQRNARNGFSFT